MSVYEFSARLNNGQDTSLAAYKGTVLLIVNTASQGPARALRQVSRQGTGSPRLPLRPVRPPRARQRHRDRLLLRTELRRHIPAVLQNRSQRRRRPPALQVAQRRKGRPARRRHQMELHQVPGRQTGQRGRALRPHHHAGEDRRRHRTRAGEVE